MGKTTTTATTATAKTTAGIVDGPGPKIEIIENIDPDWIIEKLDGRIEQMKNWIIENLSIWNFNIEEHLQYWSKSSILKQTPVVPERTGVSLRLDEHTPK